MASADIAIVGMACRFAGDAKSPEAFHEMLVRGRDAWSEVPSSRYNANAFQHRSRERPGTVVGQGGYFLEQDVSKWDAPFFACSAVEASAIDPQQRLLLEVAFESLENAGFPIEAIANTETGCFVGGFTNDYKKNNFPRLACRATVCNDRMFIINAFQPRELVFVSFQDFRVQGDKLTCISTSNLRGPSLTTDTACSSSMTALHLACETIRSASNKTRSALVGGTNLILDPDESCALNALGFLSPDSRCYAFDSRANGYARGEGIGMIVLKHIDDAIRDGDPIRAVIRATGLNSDGRTAGISLPNGDAQERLILATYEQAALDPADTQYVELHGTGTKVGDPAEVGAVSRTIATRRSKPLYCGSVKTRIGHTEGAAGIAAVIKCVLAMENGVIPPNLNFSKPNFRLRLETSNLIVPTESILWPECEIRRCSINNFGFGGTNAHVIVDDGHNYMRCRSKATSPNKLQSLDIIPNSSGTIAKTQCTKNRARLFVLSAPEQDAISRQRQAHADYAEANCTIGTLPQIAYTLSERRAHFQWRHAVVASTVDELIEQFQDNSIKPVKTSAYPNVAFVFTGQGAQWYAMGRELIVFDVFAESVRKSATCLMADVGCPWDAWTELMASESDSKVNQAEYSQPLCSVLQIALVELLAHWSVKPIAVVGHSSGEIAAAYAARALSRQNCLKVAYHRGLVSTIAKKHYPGGSMMAVGLSVENIQLYLAHVQESVVVACVNSPQNVTLAGDKADLLFLEERLKKERIFCRILQVENAYHSPLMWTVSEDYRERISTITPMSDSSVSFFSTVYGRLITPDQLTADYWVENMCSRVELVAALNDMMFANVEQKQMRTKSEAPRLLVEVGPHAALSGPIKQYRAAHSRLDQLSYHSFLVRKQNAVATAIGTAGALWMNGVPVNLYRVNNTDAVPIAVKVLTNLPSYQWNHSTSYWHETRESKNRRFPAYARHDLIGSRLDSYNPLEPVWHNHLRVSEIPWLQDHKIHGDVVFPAAGMICSVIESVRQLVDSQGSSQDVSGFELRELSISKPLVIPRNEMGAETYLHLKPRKIGMGSDAGPWLEFSFCSSQENDIFVEHAAGLVQILHVTKISEVDGGKELNEDILACERRWRSQWDLCQQKVAISSHYEFCENQGLSFGKSFQGLHKIRQNGLNVAFETKVPDSRAFMPGFSESDYLIHPAAFDAVIQSMLIAIPRMDDTQKQVWVPTGADSIRVSTHISRGYGNILRGICESSHVAAREMTGSLLIGDGTFDRLPGLIIDGLRFKGLGSTQKSIQLLDKPSTRLYSSVAWKPDLDLLDGPSLQMLAGIECESGVISQFSSMAYGIVNEMCRLTLAKIHSCSNAIPAHLSKYVEWMRTRSMVLKNGHTSHSMCSETHCNESLEQDELGIPNLKNFIEKYPVDGKLLRHVFLSLEAIFTGHKVPIAALMAEESFSKFYKESYGLKVNIEILRKWFELKAHKKPSLRIIEIGAGTASTSLPLIRQLAGKTSGTPGVSQYTFTDISPGWFEKAKSELHDWKSHVEYKVLDIEIDPVEQGFEAESYDVVVAVNVLHATRDIHKTLENCGRLLKPGGNLVLGEYTNRDDLIHFIFGILPGWWAAEDGRKNGPLLLQSQWKTALKQAGFSGADMSFSDSNDLSTHRLSTFISTKTHGQALVPSKEIIVVVPNHGAELTKCLASAICGRLGDAITAVIIKDLATAAAGVSGKTIVSLLDYESPILDGIEKTSFEQLKHLLLHSKEVLWITRSDIADRPGHPTKRIVSGLLCCLKTEDASRQMHELHFCRDLDFDIMSTASTIKRRLYSIWGSKKDTPEEMETMEQDGRFCIPRYMPERAMNQSLVRATEADIAPQIGRLSQINRPLKLTIGQPGMLDTLHFVDDDTYSQALLDQDVEIEVQAVALNFLDIMIAMGQIQRPLFGHEAVGIVRRVGSKVTTFSEGDRVIYIGQGAMKTLIQAHESAFHSLPACLSLDEGVSIPIAFTTAYQSLVEVARLRKGESVLIHAAAGGLGQALIQIATMLGADIFCTVGSEVKRQAIISLGIQPSRIFSSRDLSFAKGVKRVTNGRGVDVIVNSLAGEALRQSWECLAPYGRFIEVGKKDILGNSGLDMRPFLKNVLFAGVNIEAMLINDPIRSSNLMRKVLKLFQEGVISYIRPIEVHDISNMESVFRNMQRGTHIGKLVLRITPESQVQIAPQKEVPLRLRPDVTYLLVGGLGGLGRVQALFMAEHGARHFAFISRSGSASDEAMNLLAKLEAIGAKAKSYAGDVANKDQLKSIILDITQTMPPIRGVIQGAMVLADSVFHKMTHEQWVAATRPKIQGSWNLHELLPGNLDFFIVLSSLAGIIGSISQANYAAGNTFQDALVHYRQSNGLPAQSLDLGVIKGFGYVEEHDEIGARFSPFELASVDKKQFFHLLRCALAGTPDGENSLTTQLIVGAGSGGIMQASQKTTPEADFYWLRTLPQFAYLRQMDIRDAEVDECEEEGDEQKLIDQLKLSKSVDEANQMVQDLLLARISKVISLPVADINTAKPVYTYGVDSLVAVELRNWLSIALKSDLSIFDLISSVPISEVSKKIASRSQLVPKAVKVNSTA